MTIICGIPLGAWGGLEGWAAHRLSRASYVSNRYKYVYVETPKAACTTIKTFIYQLEGFAWPLALNAARETKSAMLIHDRQIFSMPTLADLPDDEAVAVLQDTSYFKFCFVRNPYGRFVSAWKDKVHQTEIGFENVSHAIGQTFGDPEWAISFASFAKYICLNPMHTVNHHWESQTNLTLDSFLPYTMIGHIESFDHDFNRFLNHLSAQGAEIPNVTSVRLNETVVGNWRQFYDKELGDIVYNYFIEDFNHFNYSRESCVSDVISIPVSLHEELNRLRREVYERNRFIARLYNVIDEFGRRTAGE